MDPVTPPQPPAPATPAADRAPGPRRLLPTLLTGALVAGFAAQKQTAILLILLLPFLAVWVFYSLFVIWRRPRQRRLQAIKILIWLLAVTLVAGVHGQRFRAARQDADRVAAALLAYQARQGRFPADLAELGLDAADLRRRWHLAYSLQGGQPLLFYASTLVPFETFRFDFSLRSWGHAED
jgi:hypothetical protein